MLCNSYNTPLLLTDLDNTVYNWVDFYAPCFRAMVHALSAKTGLAEEIITSQFREIFVHYGSVEYPYSVQKLKLCEGLSDERVSELVTAGRVAFGRTKRRRLTPYLGVHETLRWAQANGIPVVAVTNAPWYLAWRRLWSLGLKGLFKGIAGAEAFEGEEGDRFVQAARLKQKGFEPDFKRILIPRDLKPSPCMYQIVMEALNVKPSQTWIVGDSLAKDIAPALSIGATAVWAQYGCEYRQENWETILSITNWSKAKVDEAILGPAISPSLTIRRFDELQTIMPCRQQALWN